MAQGYTFICNSCSKAIGAWSDGNPYYLDEDGAKRYAYHPDHERLELCVGNDSPHLCLGCGAEFKVDSRSPIDRCPDCGSAEICGSCDLEGRACPYCKAGTFAIDPDGDAIS